VGEARKLDLMRVRRGMGCLNRWALGGLAVWAVDLAGRVVDCFLERGC
jgi:hypothetical protein